MLIVKVVALCVATAMICAALRVQRPEMATALSLAAGVAVLAMLLGELNRAVEGLSVLRDRLGADADIAAVLLKGAGVAVLSELGAQLCADAGETALAGRVTLAARVAMLALCAPLLTELVDAVGGALA